ncbi:uncharacterized protein LOC142331764 [Lycorma delicatula]|uniref:uncharacterized protein LOC142331764 n=1 Tax=Lycorma delicatula TaxID=130591 RepID=UPI003F51574F
MQEICENMISAIELGRTDIVKSMLDACNNDGNGVVKSKSKLLNQPFHEDGTFLALATKLNQGDIVRALLSVGADPNITNNKGLNSLDLASNEHMQQIYLQELLRAVANSDVQRVTQLVNAGVYVNAWDSPTTKNTPLHWAACYADRHVVSCLLYDYGADINAVNACGATPLHDAVVRGNEDIVEELLRAGANTNLQGTSGKWAGKTPYDLAQTQPHLAELFDRYNYDDTQIVPRGSVQLVPLPRNRNITASRSVSVDSTFSNNINNNNNYNNNSHGNNFINRKSNSTSNSNNNNIDVVEDLKKSSSPPPLISRGLSNSQGSSLDLSPRIDQVIENIVRSHVGSPVRPIVTHPSLHLLWPQPQKILELPGPPFVPSNDLQISVVKGPTSVHGILDVWEVHRPVLSSLGYDVRVKEVQPSCGFYNDSQIECSINPNLFTHQDAYQIHISSDKIRIVSKNKSGLHFALSTFTQLLRLASSGGEETASLIPVLIQDYPAMSHRAVLLDISPMSRIPTLDYLFEMIDTWSSLKVSHLHLYTRLVPSQDWQLCYKRSEMVTIDRYCQDRFISLLPVLDVENTVTRQDINDMWSAFQEILASFTNLKYVHIGPRLSGLLIGSGEDNSNNSTSSTIGGLLNVSNNHGYGLQEVWHLLSLPPEVTVMMCANSLHSQSLENLYVPSNMILIEYGFLADYDFLEWTKGYHQLGCATCLCPGTASWNSLAGCPEASICNIYRAVQAVNRTGALGVVVAHWSGSYHLTPHPFSWPGFLVSAGLSWNTDTHLDYLHNSLSALLDTHIFMDSACCTGDTILDLGNAETYTVRCSRNQEPNDSSDLPSHAGSIFYQLLTDPDSVSLDNLNIDTFAKVTKHIKRSQSCIMRAKLGCRMGEMVIQEITLSIDLMLTACKIGRCLVSVGINPNSNMGLAVINLGVCNLPPTFRTDIANKMLALIEQYKGMWLQRHLAAGLQNSLLILSTTLRRFVPEDDV